MFRTRFPRLLGALGLAVSLAGGTLFGTALAATPNLQVGTGGVGTATCDTHVVPDGQVPGAASPGRDTAFLVWAKDCDTSTIAQLFLAVDASSLNGSATATQSLYTIVRADLSQEYGTCADPLSCTFGQIKPGDSVYVTVVFHVSPDALNASSQIVFNWTSNGTGTGTGSDSSHGYIWSMDQNQYLVIKNDPNYGGAFVLSAAQWSISNAAVGSGNSQSETVAGKKLLLTGPLTVQDGPGVSPEQPCGLGAATTPSYCDALAGSPATEWVSVNVNNGESFSNAFTITITISADAIPKGVNKNNLVIYHQWFDSTIAPNGAWQEENIGTACKFGGVPCRDVVTGKDVWTITIQTYHNGYLRGY